MPKVSVTVIIPTYNRAELLERALTSVLAQSRLPDEVLVVDDGSADDTAARVREGFPSVRLLEQENAGVSAARNRGIREASGEWLAFLDSDDEWAPTKLETQMRQLEAATPPDPPPGLPRRERFWIAHSDEIWIRRGRRVNPRRRHAKRGGYIFEHCLPLCAISPSAVILHRDLFAEVGTFDETLPACEDYDLWLRICAEYPVLFVDEPLTIKYGGHADQLSRTVPALDRYRIAALARMLESGRLTAEDHGAARRMLLEKIPIYRQGAEKRGRLDEVRQLDTLAAKHRL